MPGIPDRNTAFSVSGQAIILTLSGGSAIFVITILAYSILHRFDIWPKIYSPRWYLYPNRTPMMERHTRYLFSWIKEIYSIPEDEILRTVGLDALVFLRTQRLYAILFAMCSVFGLGVLVPLNIKYGDPATNDFYKFARTTMANLPSRTRIKNVHVYRTNIAACWLLTIILLWTNIAACWLFTALTIILLWLEYRSYIALRFKWLTLPRTHNYSVMVTHIPPKMRNVTVLKAFFDKLLAPHGPQWGESIGKVLSVTLTMDLSRLENLIKERENVYRKLEHTIARYYNPEHGESCRCGKDREVWRMDLLHDMRAQNERLQILNEVVECAQQEVRRLYYGYNDPSNFGLLDIEVIHHSTSSAAAIPASLSAGEGAIAEDTPLGKAPLSPPLSPSSGRPMAVEQEESKKGQRRRWKGREKGSRKKSSDLNKNGEVVVVEVEENGGQEEEEEEEIDIDGIDVQGSPFRLHSSGTSSPNKKHHHYHSPLPQRNGGNSPTGEFESEEEGVALGLGVSSNRISSTNLTLSEDARMILSSKGGTTTNKEVKGGGVGREGAAGHQGGGQVEGRGEYGSFSPSTLPCDDRRPALSTRSKSLLDQFFRKPISSEIYGTAFVTVSTLEATAILRQTVTYQRAFELIVEEAPLPEDIIWSNVDSNFVTNYLRTAIGHLMTFAITIAFAFPTAFISALNSVETMKKRFPWIREWLSNPEDSRWLNSVLAIVAPLLLLILLSIIPPIFGLLTRGVIKDSRTISESHYNIFRRYFGFLFYNALIVFVVATGVMETLFRAYSNPAEVLNQIGSTLPKPAAFFINFIIIKALSGLPSELIRMTSFLQHLVKICFVDELTEQNRNKMVIGCRSLTHPGGFHYGKFLAEHTLLFVYVIAYSCLAPVILPAGFIFFAGSSLVYKRQLLFVYEPEYETGGKMFKLILRYTFTGLFVGQFVIFVMLVTKFAYEDIPFFLPLPIATYFAKDLIIKWYGRMDNHVPLSLAVAKDVRFWRGPGKGPSSRSGEILDLSKDTFHHPAVRSPWCELSRPLPNGTGSMDLGSGSTPHTATTSNNGRTAAGGKGGGLKGRTAYERVEIHEGEEEEEEGRHALPPDLNLKGI